MTSVATRRISYIVPAPDDPPPLLTLPTLGQSRTSSTPLLALKLPTSSTTTTTNGSTPTSPTRNFASRNPFLSASPPVASTPPQHDPGHPRHCLGVASLALDSSTLLAGASSPGGILYTGGRDGLVASWELHVPHRRRDRPRYDVRDNARSGQVKWERIGDGAEMWDESDDEDALEEDEAGADESLLAPGRKARAGVGRGAVAAEVPYEDRWEVDRKLLSTQGPPETTFRQSIQTHTDWVSAMLLCNLNQTVITASSDRTIRAWSPHAAASDPDRASPALIGRHRDYVRSLAWAKHPSVLFSGALDRHISVWDVTSPHPDTPVFSIDLDKIDDYAGVGLEGERGSVYSLGVDPRGTMLAAGTPERVVRLWDPRVGETSIGKLVGHTDCVRSIVVSDDGRYMLTGSSDTTVKLWSLAAHRCLHTFNHHTSSVWALHSNHPNLERFYSGSRDGRLCVVDVEECTDISEGECILLAREGEPTAAAVKAAAADAPPLTKNGDEGIRSIASMDDEYVWTATGSSEVRRWRDVGRRVTRLDQEDDGVSYNNYDGRLRGGSGADSAAAFASTLSAPFDPTPIIDSSLRGKKLSVDANADNSLLRIESRDSRQVAFAPSPSPRGDASTDLVTSSPGANGLGISSGPTSPTSPSGVPSSVRDRLLSPPSQRMSSLTGASIPNSIMSDTSAAGDGDDDSGFPAPPAYPMTLNGIPYESLVCLGLPDSPYALDFASHNRPDDTRTIYSTVSYSSVPKNLNGALRGEGEPVESGNRRTSNQIEHPPGLLAKWEFQDRELASEAKPLRSTPDAVIAGRSGLIRSLVLNDRQHVLTIDALGSVAVWNIIRAACIGRFSSADVATAIDMERGVDAASEIKQHPQEVLELIKERVDGSGAVVAWCAVDTKIGSLTVHLEEGRVFDAEVYADEIGFGDAEGMKEDARINLGKWTLTNLFRGLIKAEEQEVTSAIAESPASGNALLPTLSRTSAPMHINIERPMTSPRHRQRALSSSFAGSVQTPSINIAGLATPAATPAQLPDLTPPLAPLGTSAPSANAGGTWGRAGAAGLATIAQSPMGSTGTPSSIARLASPSVDNQGAGNKDYFSMRKRAETVSTMDGASTGLGLGNTAQTPASTTSAGASGGANAAPPPSPAVPSTPGGGFRGKLKGFGKKKDKPEAPMSTVVETTKEEVEEDKGPKLSERATQQMHLLDMVRAQKFEPPPPWEAPHIALPSTTSLLISEESRDAGAWVVTYRSQVASTERDMEPLEMNSPLWLLEVLFANKAKGKDGPKATFLLEPAPGSGFKDLPKDAARVSAVRILRVRKVLAFIYDRLPLAAARQRSGSVISIVPKTPATPSNPSSSPIQIQSTASPGSAGLPANSAAAAGGTVRPEEVIELVYGTNVLDPKMTLGMVKQLYGGGAEMMLHFRLKGGAVFTP